MGCGASSGTSSAVENERTPVSPNQRPEKPQHEHVEERLTSPTADPRDSLFSSKKTDGDHSNLSSTYRLLPPQNSFGSVRSRDGVMPARGSLVDGDFTALSSSSLVDGVMRSSSSVSVGASTEQLHNVRGKSVFGVSLERISSRAPFWEIDYVPAYMNNSNNNNNNNTSSSLSSNTNMKVSPFPAPVTGIAMRGSDSLLNDVAWPVTVLCDFLEENSLGCEGLFRAPGDKVQIDLIRIAMIEGRDPLNITVTGTELRERDSHAFAYLLKQFFRELPSPLLPHDLVVSAGKNLKDNDDNDIPVITGVLLLLSHLHLTNTRRLCALLHKLSQNTLENALSCAELAVCWGHTLARSPLGPDYIKLIPESNHIMTFTRRLIELQPHIFTELSSQEILKKRSGDNNLDDQVMLASHMVASSNQNSKMSHITASTQEMHHTSNLSSVS